MTKAVGAFLPGPARKTGRRMTYDQELQLYELTVICQLYPAGCPRSRNPARPWRSAVWILTQRQVRGCDVR